VNPVPRGRECRCLYAIRNGFFETVVIADDGRGRSLRLFRSRSLAWRFRGGYNDSAIALEDGDVCVMPYSLIEEIGGEVPSLHRRLHAVLGREIVRGHGIMVLLGSMSAKQRLAAFLLNLSRRYLRRGYPGSRFLLRMTREEIGSYLGLRSKR
jgi:CRP/FNR family transcriptional regulator